MTQSTNRIVLFKSFSLQRDETRTSFGQVLLSSFSLQRDYTYSGVSHIILQSMSLSHAGYETNGETIQPQLARYKVIRKDK